MERVDGETSSAPEELDGSRRAGLAVLLFDLDGVLWDTSLLHARAFDEVCRHAGLAPVPYQELAGRTTDEAWRVIAAANGRSLDPTQLAVLRQHKQELARAQLRASAPLSPEVDVVAAVSGTRPLGLVTGASAGTAEIFLRAADIAFDVVITAADVQHGKPDPEPYLLAAHRLGVSPARCWVLEDSVQGIESGAKAGMQVVHLAEDIDCTTLHMTTVTCVTTIAQFVQVATQGSSR